jgi:hypothetical protein
MDESIVFAFRTESSKKCSIFHLANPTVKHNQKIKSQTFMDLNVLACLIDNLKGLVGILH